MTSTKKKPGRTPRFAVYNGQVIEGLYVAYRKDGPVRNHYYLDKNGKQKSCTSDITEAVRRYQKHLEDNDLGKLKRIPEQYQTIPIGRYGLLHDPDYISDDYVVERFLELMEQDRYRMAKLTGIPQLAHLEDVMPLAKPLTLQELIDRFSEKHISKQYLYDVKTYWEEFSRIVNKPTIRDVRHIDISTYEKAIYDQARNKMPSNEERYINNRFNAIKAVLRYCRKKFEYKKDIRKALEHLEQLTFVVNKRKKKPRSLAKAEFKKLYKMSKDNVLGRCLLLLGINCGLRMADIIDIRKDDVAFEDKTFSKPRTKSGIIQSAILWDETIEAMQEYMKERPNDSDRIFLTIFDNPYTYQYLIRPFNQIREKAGMKRITHKMLRISGNSIANKFRCNPNAISTYMGWSISNVDNSYNERNPEATENVVKVIYDYYMGEKRR